MEGTLGHIASTYFTFLKLLGFVRVLQKKGAKVIAATGSHLFYDFSPVPLHLEPLLSGGRSNTKKIPPDCMVLPPSRIAGWFESIVKKRTSFSL